MRNFKRDNKSGQRSMYQATCAECGAQCEVPFQPTGDKPVYCSNCFEKRKGGSSSRPGRRDFDRPRSNRMFPAICDKCGQKCEVPFQPTAGKPIFCEQCFGKKREVGPQKSDQLQVLNAKLDKILDGLVAAKIIKLPKEEKPVKAEKKPAEKKPAKKKTAIKKKK